MSGNIDIHSKKRVLIVAANPGVSPSTGWPIGFWWAELTHPYWTFTEAGYEVEIVSPKGGDLVATAIPTRRMPAATRRRISCRWASRPRPPTAALLQGTKAVGGRGPCGI